MLMLMLMPLPAVEGPSFGGRFNTRTHSVNPDRLGNLDGQAGMPFRFLVPLLTRAGWFCAMTPRAPSCRSLRYAACGSALWARELLLWPPLGIFGGIP